MNNSGMRTGIGSVGLFRVMHSNPTQAQNFPLPQLLASEAAARPMTCHPYLPTQPYLASPPDPFDSDLHLKRSPIFKLYRVDASLGRRRLQPWVVIHYSSRH